MRLFFISALLLSTTDAFVPGWTSPAKRNSLAFTPSLNVEHADYSTALFAKKKAKANAKLAALDALDALDEQGELGAPLSKKEQKALEKQKKKEEKAAAAAAAEAPAQDGKKDAKADALAALDALEAEDGLDQPLSKKEQKALLKQQEKEAKAAEAAAVADAEPEKPKMSKKEEMLMKALEMEELDAQRQAAAAQDDDQPKLSKKELKALKKKEEKMAAKAAFKAEKKAARAAELEQMEAANGDAPAPNGDTPAAPPMPQEAPKRLTLEDKIRKERPPPRIRVMESSQPGYVSLRLENVGITFRDQEVLKDVTWGVQSGERIGLVGKNGAGKTTQLRILSGELEPTTGDVVKSSSDLRTAMLRQEFVDELIKERTLKEEFMSVFEEENKILSDLKETEVALENMSGEDPEKMQEILDRMQELQQRAEDKDVYVLESRVKKIMDLMGFNDDEADDLVASFSGGWKMRIGLGKVLLKDPNVLLLGESPSLPPCCCVVVAYLII